MRRYEYKERKEMMDLKVIKGENNEGLGYGASIIDTSIKNLRNKRKTEIIGGGEIVCLEIKAKTKKKIFNPILGFIIKDRRGQTILGDNTLNHGDTLGNDEYPENTEIIAEFIFTIPLLKKGQYSISVSIADGNLEEHEILHWVNDAHGESRCSVGGGM